MRPVWSLSSRQVHCFVYNLPALLVLSLRLSYNKKKEKKKKWNNNDIPPEFPVSPFKKIALADTIYLYINTVVVYSPLPISRWDDNLRRGPRESQSNTHNFHIDRQCVHLSAFYFSSFFIISGILFFRPVLISIFLFFLSSFVHACDLHGRYFVHLTIYFLFSLYIFCWGGRGGG